MKFRFVDRVHEILPGKSIRGSKTVSLEEYFLLRPSGIRSVFPPMLMVEALFQLGNILIFRTYEDQLALISMFQKIEFYEMLAPGRKLDMEVSIQSRIEDTVKINGKGYIDGTLAIEGIDCTAVLVRAGTLVNPVKYDMMVNSMIEK